MDIKYVCYEDSTPQKAMTQSQWKIYYNRHIDKADYKDFIEWWHDMTEKSNLIVKEIK